MLTKKIAYIDTEATALENGAITSIGVIIEIDGKIEEEFNLFVRPHKGASIKQEALRVTNMTEKQIFSFPEPNEVKDEFERRLSKYVDKYDKYDKFTLIGYNIEFDLKMLLSFYEHLNDRTLSYWFDFRHMVDVHELVKILQFRNKLPIYENNKLGTVCKELNLVENTNKLHDSLEDVRVTKDLFKTLITRI